ncbi:MAG TPA: IS110 family transposase [Solirubrobacteraceae bacterium]|jgi:transposase|nr:IS110 family transposase [Solirubrobacteraceae bacterium]
MGAICGIDWASDWHDVHIADESGALLTAERFSHDEIGVSALIALLLRQRVECCAIERPDGLLVGRLLAAGIVVLAIHPNQVKAARDRFRAAAGKNDRFDAFVLCELARTDRHRFPVLAPSCDETLALKALVRTREDLVDARIALANQLRAQLQASWAGAERIFADIDSPIGLAFLERYPSPTDTRGLGEKRLESFLARNAYSGRRTPTELLTRLRNAPNATIGELEQDARRSAVIGLVATLRPIIEQISQLTSQIAGATRSHPDGAIFLAFFRDPKSVITAAGLLAEIGDNRARYPTNESLAADAGQAPVTIQSGKRNNATFRWACDKRLRQHMCVLADSTRHWHPWARDVYQRARSRGCDHPHAIRILGRAWTRVLWRCWQDHTPYNPTQHNALNKLLAQKG